MPPATASTTTDTHRRTWDRAEYAEKAAQRETKFKEEGKARAEAKALGRKYYAPSSSTEQVDSSSRTSRLSVTQNVGKATLMVGSAGTGKRGRSAGFYCEDCDLTFKDNLQWVEHLNSKQHLVAVGESGEVRRATLEEVRERLAQLVEVRRREREEAEMPVDVQTRVKVAGEKMEAEREEKRRLRREKRRKTEGGVGVKKEEEEGYGEGIIC
ncbi:uncharacterized protein KY384_007246 [Bacidia gigantensis]|uniref:uncharacterized protein n=1 Tax=Bacidia gigantensis TaxID=2732470 RepID=UPI001D0528D6|nr:uncharacterized protein KY384_007246 [Bacidia gigantensis]KAG8528328.1 hypothetical protein KY384_007246 [Bacidia gigantensis]